MNKPRNQNIQYLKVSNETPQYFLQNQLKSFIRLRLASSHLKEDTFDQRCIMVYHIVELFIV